ncbi:MAG: hypothetical protein IPF83_04020 [Rhodanobacteraceae bacterium]|nr:hypothetical protein [Rhodanobacteraceae bacterium]
MIRGVVIVNLADSHEESLTMANHPRTSRAARVQVPFSRELWIGAEDFLEVPPG